LYIVNWYNENNFFYRNNGEGFFTKDTTNTIVLLNNSSASSVWGDYNNDGFLDLFVSNYQGTNNSLFKNNGDATFTQIVSEIVATDGGFSRSASWGDINNDGFLDLVVSNGPAENNFMYLNNKETGFTKITNSPVVSDGGNSTGTSWCDFDNDGDLDLFIANTGSEQNFFYINNGNGTFLKETNSTITTNAGNSASGNWGNYNNYGYMDLFVTNAGGQNNTLYKNNGDGTFMKITSDIVSNDGGDSNGSSWADYDNDEDLDLFVNNRGGENNFLYSNTGDGSFIKITNEPVVNDGGSSECGA
jgi:hypothetical protein